MSGNEIATIGGYKLTAAPDMPDLRDWAYQPALLQLKSSLPRPRQLSILDQGEEGACTGFALAAVIDLLRRKSGRRGRVSPRMLYEMAKRHDEWRGFRYEGSSCRGAIQGFYNMGVCAASRWPYRDREPGHLTVEAAKDARNNTLGAYYRLGTRISDFHAALNEVGAIYCSANVHEGWERVDEKNGRIPFDGPTLGGHAFAIIGYNRHGFWIQNSWGDAWGRHGTALWTYEDWQKNIGDAWVLQLALPTPQIWHLPPDGGSDAGKASPRVSTTPARAEIAGHFVHIDDGEFHDSGRYWSNLADVLETSSLLESSDKYDHLLFYAHGGVTDIESSARRIAAMKQVFKANGIYPYHFMYDTGLLEELKDVIVGKSDDAWLRAGGLANWTDRLLEQLTQKPGRALWREMKYGARSPFDMPRAGWQTVAAFVAALGRRSGPLQLHLVGHSAGSILLAHLAAAIGRLAPALRIRTVSLLAPAMTNEMFRSSFRPLLVAAKSTAGIDRMTIYNLNDKLEREDSVAAVYRKSILYLVSRSFEEDPRPAPILGMEKHNKGITRKLPRLRIHYSRGAITGARFTASESHGGFDNDPVTMNDVLRNVLGRTPLRRFTLQNLAY